uniref:CCHC-type domain-containing protein n=1 Tax=Tanacetum cinerariifolium TaxID=118510 RepID=A0A6L2MUP5_TANCI|nr:hypothetical protein [Tanacetum cinerariifolium]
MRGKRREEKIRSLKTRSKYVSDQEFRERNKKTYNNDKSLSEVQLEHEKEDEFVVVVVKTLEGKGGESFWEGGDDFRVDVLCFHTCLTDILGILEKLEWWFEQDIDKEEKRFEGDEDGGEDVRMGTTFPMACNFTVESCSKLRESHENFLKSLTAMAYSSSSLPEVEHSSSLDSFLAFKAIDFLSTYALTILKSFLMIILSQLSSLLRHLWIVTVNLIFGFDQGIDAFDGLDGTKRGYQELCLAMYLQQFWKTVIKMPDTEDTIIFKLDSQEIVYIVDMFQDTLNLLVETLEKVFVAPVNIEIIKSFMNMVDYQGMVDKVNAFNTKNLAQPWKTMFKDYHSIKDDISLVSVYTTRNVLVRGMLILDKILTKEICATDDYKEYEMVFVNVVILINQSQPIVSTQGTHRQKQVSKGAKDEQSYDDADDSMIDEKEGNEMGSLEIRTEKMQTPIPTTPRSPRINLSSDNNIVQELTNTVSLLTPTTSKAPHMQIHISSKYSHLPDDLIENNLKPSIGETIIEDHDAFQSENNVIQVHPTTNTSIDTTSSADLQKKLYLNMKISLQDRDNDIALWEVLKRKFEKSSTSNTSCRDDAFHSQHHDDHQDDDAPPEEEKSVKSQKTSKSSKSEAIIDEDKVIPEDETPELIIKFQNVDKRVSTIFDRARMEATLNDMLRIDSYQVKVNLTAPTLTFPDIEAHESYLIIDKPTMGLIYLNNKDEKQVMYLVEIVKFYDATLEKVSKEVKLKIFQSEPSKKPPLLDSLLMMKSQWSHSTLEWLRFGTIVKQTHDLDTISYNKLFDILKQYQKEVNEIRAERITMNANPLALVATAQQYPYSYYEALKSHKSYASSSSKKSSSTRSHVPTRHKGKEIAKLLTPSSESASEEDSDLEQAQRDKDMQKNLALIAKYFKKIYKPTINNLRTSLDTKNKNMDTSPSQVMQQTRIQSFNCKEFGHFAKECRKPKRVKDYTYHKVKMLLCKQVEKGVPLQAEQVDWLEDTDEEIDEKELEAHYSHREKIKEVPTADLVADTEPLEKVQYNAEYNVIANEGQNLEQPKSINNTCVVERVDSNVSPDSLDMCDNDNQADQNDKACDDKHVALANLVANLKLDIDENKDSKGTKESKRITNSRIKRVKIYS